MKSFSSKILQWLKKYRAILGVIVIVLSLGFLTWYLITHPEIITNLLQTNPLVILALLVLYVLFVGLIFFINLYTVRVCGKDLAVKPGIFLTIYSTVINFFGPLQSGPAVRAAYLKTKIGLKIRDYTMATLFYYFAYAAINASLLFISSWWILTILGFIASIAIIIIGAKLLHFQNQLKNIFALYLVAFTQAIVMTAIYYTELHATGTHSSLLHTVVYTASANLSLFVSLTPGGIGIREAFIVFTTSLHHIPLSSIISAGVLDRAFYVIFLTGLFLATSGLHLKKYLTKKS